MVEEISGVPKSLHGMGMFLFLVEMGIWVDSRKILAAGRVTTESLQTLLTKSMSRNYSTFSFFPKKP